MDGETRMTRRYRKRGITYFTPPPIVPIPLRSDLTVYIQGMPMDMTYEEACKISRVIMALSFALPKPVEVPEHE
jgi:hypothetical protein